MMRIITGKLVSAFVVGALAVTPSLAKEPERKELYGPPDEKTAPLPQSLGTSTRRSTAAQRLPVLENIYRDHDFTETMEITEGVFGTIKPVRARISIPFGHPKH